MPGILKMLEALEQDKSPFVNKILDTKGAKIHYIRLELVANFEFATWTKSGRIRKPATFLGFRKDKNPKEVVREVPKETQEVEELIETQIKEEEQSAKEGDQAESRGKVDINDTLKADVSVEKGELSTYRKKRSFDQTPEPQGGHSDSDQLTFVVQKHDASHLHYDFRLEVRGVLKSWAVPKGPSMNPEDHRLAMETEDHPFDYKDFEGIIPEGQYGGGTVLVWDNGTYEPAELIEGKKNQEKWLLSSYFKNKLSIILHGKKLKGKFSLVKTFGKADNAWLLTKAKDEFATDTDVTKLDQSILSGYTILEMAMDSRAKQWQSNRESEISAYKTDAEETELTAEITGPDAINEPEENGSAETEDQDVVQHTLVAELFPRAQNKRSKRSKLSAESNWNKIFEEKIKSEGQIEVEKTRVSLYNIEKKLWKTTNKAQLISYYNQVSG